jgi:DNA-binding protein HU-beta
LKKGEPVSIAGFGTFAVRKRSPRMGRNPKTGEPVQINSAKVPIFKSASALKNNLN